MKTDYEQTNNVPAPGDASMQDDRFLNLQKSASALLTANEELLTAIIYKCDYLQGERLDPAVEDKPALPCNNWLNRLQSTIDAASLATNTALERIQML